MVRDVPNQGSIYGLTPLPINSSIALLVVITNRTDFAHFRQSAPASYNGQLIF